jgi:hypothetical protein
MKTFQLIFGLMLSILLFGTIGCKKDSIDQPSLARDYRSDVPLAWNSLIEIIDRYAPGYRPPAASRMFGYIGLAAYEAAVPGMPGNRSLGNHFSGLFLPVVDPNLDYHWPSAVNAAYHAMMVKAYPHISNPDKLRIQTLNQTMEQTLVASTEPDVYDRSKAFGEAVADAVFYWSKNDVIGHEAYLDPHPVNYQPPQGPGKWQPTWPDYTRGLFPYWGQVRTFAMSGSDIIAKEPLAWSEDPNSQLFKQAKETYEVVSAIQSGQNAEGMWIAQFWSDDFQDVTFTPACRMIAITTQIVKLEKPSLDIAVELYAKVGMAMADAAIAVWNSKYLYNYERPIQYIRRNFDPNWKTNLANPQTGESSLTPPFPAYPSGHAGFAASAAGILAGTFGNQYTFTDNCHKERTDFNGAPRTYTSFTKMAEEDAFSRLPLGVHFRMDYDEGLRLGFLAAQRVQQLPWN